MKTKPVEITIILEPHAADFIEKLSDRMGTPANEVAAAIINGHMGRWD